MKYTLSYSGGKDSTVMLLEIIKRKLPLDYIIFMDTTFELPEMYDYIDMVEKYINRPIIRLQPNKIFEEWFGGTFTRGRNRGIVRGFPLQYLPCYWQREAKTVPFDKFVKDIGEYKNYVGYTTDEKHRIMLSDVFLYPLIEWGYSEKDCLEYLKEIGLLNPLYNKFKRTGCFWCHKQPLRSLKVICNEYPEQWEWIKAHEKNSPNGYRFNFSCEEFEKKYKI